MKCKAVVKENFIDDLELDDENVGEIFLDENAVVSARRSETPSAQGSISSTNRQIIKPISQSGRLSTGFTRPLTSCRPVSGAVKLEEVITANRGNGAVTSRPLTTMGRELRLGSASIIDADTSVGIDKLNVKKWAHRTGIAMILFEYMLYVEHNISKALEICAEASEACKFNDWCWISRLGRCYFRLRLFRDAEKQYRSSLKIQPTISTYLELSNVYIRLGMPNSAMDLLHEASNEFTTDPSIVLGIARLCYQLNDQHAVVKMHRRVLSLDASNIEALASLGAHFFYSDLPELSIRYYRRLLQMGVQCSELWNNLGLGCFYSSQYDIALSCMDRALSISDDNNMADIWFNVGHIGVALGDLGLSYQAFKVAVAINPNHREALNNIAVLEVRRMKFNLARDCFNTSVCGDHHLFEPMFNRSLMAYRAGDFQGAYSCIKKAVTSSHHHSESEELLTILQDQFTINC